MTNNSASELPHIDWLLSVKLAADKEEVAKELLDMLATQLPEEQESMRQAYQSQAWDTLQDLAHRCLGATCYVGTPRLKKAAQNLENVIKDKQFMFIETAFEEMDKAVDGTIKAHQEQNF